MNANPDLKSINLDKCNERFNSFLVNQGKALQDIKIESTSLKAWAKIKMVLVRPDIGNNEVH